MHTYIFWWNVTYSYKIHVHVMFNVNSINRSGACRFLIKMFEKMVVNAFESARWNFTRRLALMSFSHFNYILKMCMCVFSNSRTLHFVEPTWPNSRVFYLEEISMCSEKMEPHFYWVLWKIAISNKCQVLFYKAINRKSFENFLPNISRLQYTNTLFNLTNSWFYYMFVLRKMYPGAT